MVLGIGQNQTVTDRQGNSATMQGIRILQSWDCVLKDCKVAKIIDIAMLRCWEKPESGGMEAAKAAPSVRTVAVLRTACPRQGAKPAKNGLPFFGGLHF